MQANAFVLRPFHRGLGSPKYARTPAPQAHFSAVYVQQRLFAQADDGHSRLQAQELRKSLRAGLALMSGRMRIGVMRVYLELN
jgi:hypothetical protein